MPALAGHPLICFTIARAEHEGYAARMEDDRKARAVSGEIMAGGKGSPVGGAPAPDVIDADYETIDAAPASADAAPGRARRPAAGDAGGLDMLKPGAAEPRRRRGEKGGPLFWATGVVLVFTAFWISGGHALVKGTGLLAPPSHAPELRIANLQSRVEKRSDRTVLMIDGEAVNEGGEDRSLPDLSINVLDNDGGTTHYLLGTNASRLAPGQRFGFSSRLIAPKAGVKTVSVSFEEQED